MSSADVYRFPVGSALAGQFRRYSEWGMYPMLYLTREGNVLCAECATNNTDEGDPVIDGEVNYEDANLYCDDCSARIESAYAEDEVQS